MPRTLIAIALCALAAPALAAGQHPADSARAHPAASAHANSVAGQAGAARLEACAAAANTFLDQLAKGDFKAATTNFDATMRAGLGVDKLGEAWQSISAQFGKLEGRGAAQNVMYEGHAIVTLPLHFEKTDVNAQVACDADGKIAGFHIQPIPSATPESASSSR